MKAADGSHQEAGYKWEYSIINTVSFSLKRRGSSVKRRKGRCSNACMLAIQDCSTKE
jgi:hypothetical protein